MLTILLGIAVSLFSELVTWLNKKLTGTVIQGNAAFLIVLVVSILVAIVKVAVLPNIPANIIATIGLYVGAIFATSQVFFKLFSSKVGLVVQDPNTNL